VVHILHSQQGRSGSTVTRWPTSMAPVSEPSASTTPTISWPGWYGIGMKGCRPCAACVSDPQTPAMRLRTSASCGRGTGTAASLTTSMWSAWTTTRRITVGAVGVDMRPLPRRRKAANVKPYVAAAGRRGRASTRVCGDAVRRCVVNPADASDTRGQWISGQPHGTGVGVHPITLRMESKIEKSAALRLGVHVFRAAFNAGTCPTILLWPSSVPS
jgi:hypothetical protein